MKIKLDKRKEELGCVRLFVCVNLMAGKEILLNRPYWGDSGMKSKFMLEHMRQVVFRIYAAVLPM